MDPEYGRRYRDLFERHWWWRARSALVLEVLRRHAPAGGWPRILDIGSGDGLFFDALTEFGTATGIEPDAALVSDGMRASGRVAIQPFDATFQPGSHYDLILFLDVLEHLPDPVAALQHARSLLAPGGVVVITVPAFKALWTAHDDWNHHRIRYSRATLLGEMTQAGLRPVVSFYFFQWVAPVKLGVRALEALRPGRPGPATVPPAAINGALYRLSRLEAGTVTRLRLPFGSSVCAVATG
jgi:SAM-dependent methyltransferase